MALMAMARTLLFFYIFTGAIFSIPQTAVKGKLELTGLNDDSEQIVRIKGVLFYVLAIVLHVLMLVCV